ncbi:uncharacterized protein TNCV_3379821 [Trichonephila clavipes]|nr:uncharacterized protein TNCV_3379821 [Trichonephila clavipes]
MNKKRKENFQWLPKELHQLKYEAIRVPQGSVRLVKKTQERKSSTCYLLITKGVTSLSPVPLKTRHERESGSFPKRQINSGAGAEEREQRMLIWYRPVASQNRSREDTALGEPAAAMCHLAVRSS